MLEKSVGINAIQNRGHARGVGEKECVAKKVIQKRIMAAMELLVELKTTNAPLIIPV